MTRSVLDLFSSQKQYLKSVFFEFTNNDGDGGGPYSDDDYRTDVNSIIVRILENCPRLQEFHVQPTRLRLNDLSRFVTLTSKLKYMGLGDFEIQSDTSMYEVMKHLPDRFDLTTLHIECAPSVNGDDLYIAFLERCPVLQHLRMGYISDEILQVISKNLVSKLSFFLA